MPIYWTHRFKRDWKKLPEKVKEKAGKAALLLERNRNHPALRLKRLQRLPGYWEIRVDNKYRILLLIDGNNFTFVTIGQHKIVGNFRKS